ncbi:MAG: polyphosphate kinase 1 [Dorea sp.]|nr:polyphosphate kinase 1 [Dorea sp.]
MLHYTQNRELSWLKFNQRVLEEARDVEVPPMERMKFVAIFTSNLDEFFMIRVGSLLHMVQTGHDVIDKRTGLSASEQLAKIFDAVRPLYKERDKTYAEIKNLLSPYGICGLDYKELEPQEKKWVKKYFKEQVLPILSPQVVDANHPFPHLINKNIYVIANLKYKDKSQAQNTILGMVPVPDFIPGVLYLPGHDIRYIRMEKLIMEHLDLVFNQFEVTDPNYICVTRNGDVEPDDDELADNVDFRKIMRETLHKRRKMAVVRLECAVRFSDEMEKYFCEKLQIQPNMIYRTKMPMKMSFIFEVAGKLPKSMQHALTYSPFTPQPCAKIPAEGNMLKIIKKKDLLCFYPYENMDPFLRLIKDAANDPSVMTIKITIYRLAKQAKIVEYLCEAAQNGKEVTVLIELRARFDEENNINWSERLEAAGCRIIYGFDGYKVHSKICLITYRNRNNIEYITQIGTGNYNEKTAAMYTDFSLMTANDAIGHDAAEFFKNMSISNLQGQYENLIVSPVSLKSSILALIDREIEKGEDGRVIMKMNSLTDIDFIKKVSEASKAGVKIDLIVRGICCLRPGVAGYTDNVRIQSVVGRYLEHPRVYSFGTGASQVMYIGSADMMTRNTEKRVEVMCPILDADIKEELNEYLDIMLHDNVKARVLQSDGTLVRKLRTEPRIDSQAEFMKMKAEAKPYIAPVKEKKPGIFKRLFGKKK